MAVKKFLVRAGMTPYEPCSLRQFLEKSPNAKNIGNLVYAYGVFRALMKDEETCLDADGYRAEYGLLTEGDIDRINQTYEAYIIPLADAFRPTFCMQLRNLARVIRQLKIPAIVIGVGMKAPLDYDLSWMEPCNEDVRLFVNAVLDNSALIGLRGEHTARYLKSLGYVPEKDFTPIGCPSMYCRGVELPISSRSFPAEGEKGTGRLDQNASLILSNNVYASETVHRFMNRVMTDYSNYIYIPQRVGEIRSAYYGIPMPAVFREAKDYPSSYSEPPYTGGKVRMVFDMTAWWNMVKGSDLSVGPRLHGSIMCMLAGVPTLVLSRDTRMLEVCEYHSFAYWKQSDLTDDLRLNDLVDKVDFQEVSRRHSANFEHYCDFLKKNGLEHSLYNRDIRSHSPLDEKLARVKTLPLVRPYCQTGPIDRLWRSSQIWYRGTQRDYKKVKKKVRRKLRGIISRR